MEPWLFWVIVAGAFAVGEIFTLSFFLAPFAGGALAAALVSALAGNAAFGLVAFLLVSVVLLLALRPVARHHLRTQSSVRTGAARLVGETATVLEDAHTVKLDGEVWTARPYDEDTALEPGAKVTVMEIRGATALVSD